MAQLFKGHILDDGQYPMPAGQGQVPAAPGDPAAPTIDANELKRAAGELKEIVGMVGAMGPAVAQMHDALRSSAQQQGYADGISRAQAEVQQQLMEAIAALTEAQQQRHTIALANDSALGELAMRIARKVIGAHLIVDTGLVARIVATTIRELEPTTALDVRVHPDDLAAVQANRAELERLVTGRGTVTITADDTVDRGGCVLVSPVGEVDARIETKLGVLETAFAAQRRKLIEGL